MESQYKRNRKKVASVSVHSIEKGRELVARLESMGVKVQAETISTSSGAQYQVMVQASDIKQLDQAIYEVGLHEVVPEIWGI
jgi:ribonucleotide monophosphatase NagD (HAD superfamily)